MSVQAEDEIVPMLACPFCGGEPSFYITQGDLEAILCQGCAAKISAGFGQSAISAWNTRVKMPAQRLIEALGIAEKHVETLHSLTLCASPKSEATKILWRDLATISDALAEARGLSGTPVRTE